MSLRGICASLTLLTTLAATPAPSASGCKTCWAQAFAAESYARDPLFADSVGLHRYDDRLADYSAAGHAARIAWLQRWRAKLDEAIAVNASDPPAAADAHALRDTIDLELFEDRTLRPWQTDPSLYTNAIGNAVYTLTSRTFAPEALRLANVAARLKIVPTLAAAAQANLSHPSRTATLQAIDANAGNIEMYAALPKTAAIRQSLPGALSALRTFQRFLRGPLLARSNGSVRVGAAVYDRELLLDDGTDATRAELEARAKADFEATRAEMLELALPLDREFFPDLAADESKPNAADIVVRRVLDRLAGDHPARDRVFATAKGDVEAAESFLSVNPVVVLPQPPTLRVVPTPAFMAGFSGASFEGPGPYSPLAESYYYIDEIPASWSAGHVSSYLRDFNTYEMKMLSIHEAVPGHYVQQRYNNDTSSLVRRVFGNGSYIEGWAVYTEGMMLDSGYGDNDPKLRLFQLKWRLREQSNLLIDAGFHAEGMTKAQIEDLLVRQAFQEQAQFETKWHRLQLSHNQLSSYYVGLDAIARTRDGIRRELGPNYDLAAFNLALLRLGSVEPRFVAPLLDPQFEPK